MEYKGLYLHIPFCASKCAYCNFYSKTATGSEYDNYVTALCNCISNYKVRFSDFADTLYIGGGTPSVLGTERLCKIIESAKPLLCENPEITVEFNPADDSKFTFIELKKAGVNRLSLGVQSAIEDELKILNRRHTNSDVVKTIASAKSAGITNISLDLMLGVPNQTIYSLQQSLDFLMSLHPTHISTYILKIEPDTPFGRAKSLPNLPNEDTVCEMYLFVCDYLKKNGFEHYEVSNFAKPKYRSKHNSKYWSGTEYLGLGPSAYSYLNGKRFHFESSIEKFIISPKEIFDENGGSKEEYIMLHLRTSDGILFEDFKKKFNTEFPITSISRAKSLEKYELLTVTDKKISLTDKGFLLSNSVILKILGEDFD